MRSAVRVCPGPPSQRLSGLPVRYRNLNGAVAQLGEHLLCKQGVSGSIPLSSTKVLVLRTERLSALSLEEIKVCVCQMAVRLFCIHCEEKIDLEASRCFGEPKASETFPSEPFDGLAGRRLVRDWR